MNKWLKTAIVLGTAPLVVATSIFLAWVAIRWTYLAAAGIITIYVGLVSVSVGLFCLAVVTVQTYRRQELPRRPLRRQLIVTLVILLLNFPAAAAFTYAAFLIETRYVVTVSNQSSSDVESFLVDGGGVHVELGPLRPGQSRSRGFYIQHDDGLSFSGSRSGVAFSGTLDGYVTINLGGHKNVVISPDGSVSVDHEGHLTER
jgi:hypothetical protein